MNKTNYMIKKEMRKMSKQQLIAFHFAETQKLHLQLYHAKRSYINTLSMHRMTLRRLRRFSKKLEHIAKHPYSVK